MLPAGCFAHPAAIFKVISKYVQILGREIIKMKSKLTLIWSVIHPYIKMMITCVFLAILSLFCAPTYYIPHIVKSSNSEKPAWILHTPSSSSYIYIIGSCMGKSSLENASDCAVKDAFSKLLLGYFGVQMNLEYTGIEVTDDRIELKSNGYIVGAKQAAIYWELTVTKYPDHRVSEGYNVWILLAVSRQDIRASVQEDKKLRERIIHNIESSMSHADEMLEHGFVIDAISILMTEKDRIKKIINLNQRQLLEGELDERISKIFSGLSISSSTTDIYIAGIGDLNQDITIWVKYKDKPVINIPVLLTTSNNQVSFKTNPVYTDINGIAIVKLNSVDSSTELEASVDLDQFRLKNYPDISTYIAIHLLHPELGEWSNAGSLPQAVESEGAVAFNSRIYIIGGLINGNRATNNVTGIAVDKSGDIKSLESLTPMNTPRASSVILINNNTIYAIAGGENKQILNTVEYTHINGDGSLQPWRFTAPLNEARLAGGGCIYNGYIYIIGGLTANMVILKSVEYARINADGSIAEWNYTTPLNTATAGMGVFVNNGYIYVIGGWNKNTIDTIQRASINPDGTLGGWEDLPPLDNPLSAMGVAFYNGWVFMTGGRSDIQRLKFVTFTHVIKDSLLGSWDTANPLPHETAGAATIILGNKMYVIGGWDGQRIFDTILFTTIHMSTK